MFPRTPDRILAVIITCPHCRTRYRVAVDAIGAAGRQVLCASCHEAWHAGPDLPPGFPHAPEPEPDADETAFLADEDTLFTPADEGLLDAAMAMAETGTDDGQDGETAGGDGQADPRLLAEGQKALARRRRKIDRTMPLARFRRGTRLVVGALVVLVLGVLIGLRTEVVRFYPELDALYARVGLGTNIVGLDFEDVRTLRTTRDGIAVLMVTARLANVTHGVVDVPPVIVSLVNGDEQAIYAWSVVPAERVVQPGSTITLETQLTAPPAGVEGVHLTFAYGQNRLEPMGPPDR